MPIEMIANMSYRVRVSYVTHSGGERVKTLEVVAPSPMPALNEAMDTVRGQRGVKRTYSAQVVGQPIPLQTESSPC